MNIAVWIIFGMILGVIINFLDPRPTTNSFLGAMILGVLGSVLGGFVANLVFNLNIGAFNFTSLVVAIVGSLFLLFASRAIRER